MCVLHRQHRHYSKVTVCYHNTQAGQSTSQCPPITPSRWARCARDTLTAPRVWLKTDRSWACTCTHCGRSGWAGSSAFPLRSCGDTPGPGSALSLSEHSHQRERRGSSRPRRTSPGIQHAAEEESTTGQFYLKAVGFVLRLKMWMWEREQLFNNWLLPNKVLV